MVLVWLVVAIERDILIDRVLVPSFILAFRPWIFDPESPQNSIKQKKQLSGECPNANPTDISGQVPSVIH